MNCLGAPTHAWNLVQSQTIYRPILADLLSASVQSFLHFELYNCGNNFPTVSNAPIVPVRTVFDIKPSGTNGTINGQVLGNDSILCGGVASTQYHVTLMKDNPANRQRAFQKLLAHWSRVAIEASSAREMGFKYARVTYWVSVKVIAGRIQYD